MPALSIGISEDVFWKLNPNTIEIYFEAFEIQEKRRIQNHYIAAYYIKSALESSVLFTVQPSKKEDFKKIPKFIDMPFKDELKPKKLTEEEKDAEIKRAELYFKNLVAAQKRSR